MVKPPVITNLKISFFHMVIAHVQDTGHQDLALSSVGQANGLTPLSSVSIPLVGCWLGLKRHWSGTRRTGLTGEPRL